MIPPLIVRRACELGLGLIAVTDHNTAENVSAVCEAAEGTGVVVLPGMEVQTREEVHILCLFDTLAQVMDLQELVYAHLPALKNQESLFGAQYVVDKTGDLVRVNERLLLISTKLSVEELVAGVRERGGLPIAAHVDRPTYSLLSSLGFIPEGLALGAVEITHRISPEEARARFPELRQWPLVMSGDAHRLSEMRAGTFFYVQRPTVAELELALKGACGRMVQLCHEARLGPRDTM